MAAITVRVSDDTADKLDQLAHKLDRSRAAMAEQAMEDFVRGKAGKIPQAGFIVVSSFTI